MRKSMFLVVLLLGIILCTACSAPSADTQALQITFANPQWDSVLVHNAIAGYIAETAFGYTWKEIPGSTPITFEGLKNGDIDVYMEMWSQNLPSYQSDLDAQKFKELGINFADNRQGVYVPRYVVEGEEVRGLAPLCPDLKTLADLKNYSHIFPDDEKPEMGRIYGAVPGWEANEILRKRVTHLGLLENYVYFQPGSDAALATAISSAYALGKPIAAYYWEPTWLTGLYDFILLEDEPYRDEESYAAGETAFPSAKVTICASNPFAEKAPEYCDFLSKYQTSSALTSAALAHMQKSNTTYLETAKWFLRENDDLLTQWLPESKAQAVRKALAEEGK